jgi:hypothetical protein
MDIATSHSMQLNTELAIEEAIFYLNKKIAYPKVILVYFTVEHDVHLLQKQLVFAFPNTQILGCSSCQGAMTESGYHADHTLTLWGLRDHHGAYGSAVSAITNNDVDPKITAQNTVLDAIDQAQRPGELPRFILFHATPGIEETLISGIEEILGSSVPIIGGSAADNFVQGNWQLFNQEITSTNGIAIMVFYPSCQISYSFHSGYVKTGKFAVATKVNNRELLELDHKPAAKVYEEWRNSPWNTSKNTLTDTALHPLGRVVGKIYDHAYFKLSHPQEITKKDSIMLFSEVKEGEVLHFMEGTLDRLITRAGRVITLAHEGCSEVESIGGIMIYCAGCMLQVKDQMNEVSTYMNKAMHDAPFVCPFTFGEQGQFIGGENAHGNLMISAVLFHRDG